MGHQILAEAGSYSCLLFFKPLCIFRRFEAKFLVKVVRRQEKRLKICRFKFNRVARTESEVEVGNQETSQSTAEEPRCRGFPTEILDEN